MMTSRAHVLDADAAVNGEGLRDVDVEVGESFGAEFVTELRHSNHLVRLVLDRKTQNVPETKTKHIPMLLQGKEKT